MLKSIWNLKKSDKKSKKTLEIKDIKERMDDNERISTLFIISLESIN